MRLSRIPHPPGERFLQIHSWAVREVGKAAAAVLAVVDFLDRAQEKAGTPVASRTRIIADLEGFVGRDAIDDALGRLVALGWLCRHELTTLGTANLITRVEYALDADAIATSLQGTIALRNTATPEIRTSGTPEIRTSGSPESRTGNRPEKRSPQKEKEKEKEDHHHLGVDGRLGGGGERSDWQEAVSIEIEIAAASPRGVRNPAALKKSIMARYAEQGGPDSEVLAEVERRRNATKRLVAQEASRLSDAPPATPETASRGLARAKAALQRGATT